MGKETLLIRSLVGVALLVVIQMAEKKCKKVSLLNSPLNLSFPNCLMKH